MNVAKIDRGDHAPEQVNVIVEIPQGSSIKYELDKDSGALVVDRFLHTAMAYPFNYGFIPHTHAEDGDPVDVLMLSSFPVAPGSVIMARPIGLLQMEDEAGRDDKIIAVPLVKIDPHYADVEDIDDLGTATKNKIKHFFETYKELEPGKWVKTTGFMNKEIAMENIRMAFR